MSLFRPFARRKEDFVATHRIAEPASTAVEPEPVAQPDASHASPTPAPAPNRNTDPPPPTRSLPPQTLEAALAEAEVRLRGELAGEWARATDALTTANRLLDALQSARREVIEDSAEIIAQVVLALATRVVQTTLAVDDEALAQIVRNAAAALPADPVKIRMAPSDVERVRGVLPAKLSRVLEEDPMIDGGCIVQTRRASVDATLDAARAGLREVVEAWRREREG